MKIFHCDSCQQLVFFENTQCVKCAHDLAYLSDIADMGSLEPAGDGLWHSPARGAEGKVYRQCRNIIGSSISAGSFVAGFDRTTRGTKISFSLLFKATLKHLKEMNQ